MNDKAVRFERVAEGFLFAAFLILLATGTVKLGSLFQNFRILEEADPITGLRYGFLLPFIGVLEYAVAAICFARKDSIVRLFIVAWLSTGFLLYRLVRYFLEDGVPCPCLGTLPQALGISTTVADWAAKSALLFLLCGSYGVLFARWRMRHAVPDRCLDLSQLPGRTLQ